MTGRLLVLTLTQLGFFLIQVSLAPMLTISGVKPDFGLAIAVMTGLVLGVVPAVWSGIMQGFLFDLWNGYFLGLNMLWMGLTGLFAGQLQRASLGKSRLSSSITVAFFTLLVQGGTMISLILLQSMPAPWQDMTGQIMGVTVYNGFAVFLLFPLFRNATRWWKRGLPRG